MDLLPEQKPQKEKEVSPAPKAANPIMRRSSPVMIRLNGHEYPAVVAGTSKDGKKVDLQFWYGPVKPKVMGVPAKFIYRAVSGKQVYEEMKTIGENPENAQKIVRLAEALAKV